MPDLRIRKHAIFVDEVEKVRQRIKHLASWPSSPFLVEYKDVQISPRHLVVAMGSTADSVLEPLQCPATEEEARITMRGVLRALYALHSRHLVHGHIRLDTFRVHRPSGVILLAQHVLPIYLFVPSSDIGREVWRCCAPEIKRNSAFDYSADIWAVGAVFMQLMAPQGKLYETEDLLEVDVISPEVMQLSPSAVSFAVQCLQEDAGNRPTLAELLVHPFLIEEDEWTDSCGTESDDLDEER
ncbi:putative protein kinase [Trypanosoma grayi]|uniref:putative protein kinase n=1 Tax=Trypanosoma grayi TaxID=71804 RepID=UPI0004F41423|nr:putative protein kinase [Trypanosoma grayi]KEG10826.1 putative protein kinase [Trypanosoma grayi]